MIKLSQILSEIRIQGGGKLPFERVKHNIINEIRKEAEYNENINSFIISNLETCKDIEDLLIILNKSMPSRTIIEIILKAVTNE